jgi:hypothetical protein
MAAKIKNTPRLTLLKINSCFTTGRANRLPLKRPSRSTVCHHPLRDHVLCGLSRRRSVGLLLWFCTFESLSLFFSSFFFFFFGCVRGNEINAIDKPDAVNSEINIKNVDP